MKEIREAVGWAKAEVELLYGYDDVLNKNTKEMLNILIDLAEKVLAVGIGFSTEEFEKALNQSWYENYGDPKHPYSIELADAIHKAQMEKLGGE